MSKKSILGHMTRLRLVEISDAPYIHQMRTNDDLNTHISSVTGGVDLQRAWISLYKEREAESLEFYFVIERLDGEPCGLVRLYKIEGDSFTWGSWILGPNKPPKAALDSAVSLYQFAFDELGLSRATFEVDRGNERTLLFHDRFGAHRIGKDSVNIYYKYDATDFGLARSNFALVLGGK